MRSARAVPLALTAAAALSAVLSPPAPAATVGLGDQKAAVFSDGRLRALGLRHARLIVPWNAATSEPQVVQAWLDATAAAACSRTSRSSTCAASSAR